MLSVNINSAILSEMQGSCTAEERRPLS